MSYAEIAAINSPSQPQHHLDEDTRSFIELLKNSNALHDNLQDRLAAYSREIDKICDLINDSHLTAYQRNNDHYPITFEFPGASQTELEAKKLELSKFKIPLENLFISKDKRSRIHALIKHESSLVDILNNRSKLGAFYTSSKDFHVLTGIIKIKEDKVEMVKQIIQSVTPFNIPFAFYHSSYLNGYLTIFGLIEYKREDKVTYLNSTAFNIKLTIRCATRAIFNERKTRASSTENGKIDIKPSAPKNVSKPTPPRKKNAKNKRGQKETPAPTQNSSSQSQTIAEPNPSQNTSTQHTLSPQSQTVAASNPSTTMSAPGDHSQSNDTVDNQTHLPFSDPIPSQATDGLKKRATPDLL
ncbi:hypothetical protein RB653_004000 [Dictyostelium firmibasis]|uniref:Uncharacterized protein n=1 Tax=Dictyostelium firmibasis TaxID=79012 RepID=A0AAN7U736_9MYCE